jgi:flagellar protein FliS
MSQNALSAYNQVGVETDVANADPHELVLMLFDGAIKAVVKARLAMTKGEVAPKCAAISKAVSIIQEGLQLSLDVKAGGEIAENLNALYDYMCIRLAAANLKNEVETLDEVGKLLMGLKNSWAAIGANQAPPKSSETVDAPPQRSAAVSYGKA